MSELQDSVTAKETEIAELKNQIDDLQYELEKVRLRNDKLENHFAEAIEKLKQYHLMHGEGEEQDKGGVQPKPTIQSGVSQAKLEDLTKEIEEWRELANNRLQELDKLHQTHRETLKEVEKLKMDVSNSFIIVLNPKLCLLFRVEDCLYSLYHASRLHFSPLLSSSVLLFSDLASYIYLVVFSSIFLFLCPNHFTCPSSIIYIHLTVSFSQ